MLLVRMTGKAEICGDAVLPYFWRDLTEILFLTCNIVVLQDYAVCGYHKSSTMVIGDKKSKWSVLINARPKQVLCYCGFLLFSNSVVLGCLNSLYAPSPPRHCLMTDR